LWSLTAEPSGGDAALAARKLYLDLLKLCLTNFIYGDAGVMLGTTQPFDPGRRVEGQDWPEQAHTMIGLKRLDNVHFCVQDVIARGVPGDLIETGVWRGGAVILMRGLLKAYGVTDRTVWAADSFAGLPPPNVAQYPLDAGQNFHRFEQLAVSLEQVQENFRRYGLLDDQVRFIKGWFRDTLPTAPVRRLAVLRVDGDLYESTMDALTHLYPKLEPGGYCIIDDYNDIRACQQAVLDYRERFGIADELIPVDWSAVFWRKTQ
jgi:O-methyltransferase